MTETQTLYLVLVLLYLSDCWVWIGNRSVLFAFGWGRNYTPKFSNAFLRSPNGGLAALRILPPFRNSYLGHWLPISLSPEGICDATRQTLHHKALQAQSPQAIGYDEIREVCAEAKSLKINGARFARCGSERQALLVADIIRRIKAAPREQRAVVLRKTLAAAFAADRATQRLACAAQASAGLRRFCQWFGLVVFVLVPAAVIVLGTQRALLPAVALMVVGTLAVAACFYRLHRKLDAGAVGYRLTSCLKMVLCPPTALRAFDFLTLNALEEFHPLLIAETLLDETRLAEFAKFALQDFVFPLRASAGDAAEMAIIAWHAEEEFANCRRLLAKQKGLDVAKLYAMPRWDGISRSYCPRCAARYDRREGECADCPGVSLRAYHQHA